MGTRKNQNALTAAEKRSFVAAVLELKRTDRYDGFVRTHNTFFTTDSDFGARVAHRGPSFLPWHRRFLLDFERALQAVDPTVNLPYWDWTTDRSPTSSLWAADFMGGNGRPGDRYKVMTGPFAFDSGGWTLTERVDTREYLRREFGVLTPTLPTAAEVDEVLRVTPYDAPPWNSASRSGFRNRLEGGVGPDLHNRVHTWVGGNMVSGMSPNDPVFWLHHCFVDKLWMDWQERHRNDNGYLPTAATANVVHVTGTMRPWGDVTPADMQDHRRFYTYA
jgi:tyrosinase